MTGPSSTLPQLVTGTVSTGLTQPLTDAQLRASAVPVSGTVATGGLTDAQLRASAVPVSLATNTPDVTDRAGRLVGVVSATGDTANGATDAGNPVKIGGKANSAAPTPVTSGQRVDAWRDLFGRAVVSDLDPEIGLASAITGLRDRQVSQRYTVLADSIADGYAAFWSFNTANGGTGAV